MTDDATPTPTQGEDGHLRPVPPTTVSSHADARAERRGLIQAIDALMRRLEKRASFEAADRRRLQREAQDLEHAAELHRKVLRQVQERQARAEAALTRKLNRLEEHHEIMEPQELANQRRRLLLAQEESHRLAEAARGAFRQSHTAALDRLVAGHRQAAEQAAEWRAEFDAMAEQLLGLQRQLSVHIRNYGDMGYRLRRAQTRALRPIPGESQQ